MSSIQHTSIKRIKRSVKVEPRPVPPSRGNAYLASFTESIPLKIQSIQTHVGHSDKVELLNHTDEHAPSKISSQSNFQKNHGKNVFSDQTVENPPNIMWSTPSKKLSNDRLKTVFGGNKSLTSRRSIIIIGIIIFIAFVALSGLAIGIYSIVRTSSTSSNSLGTTSFQLRWNTVGTTVAGIGSVGGGISNRLYYPRKIVFASSSVFYIADPYDNRIVSWTIGSSFGVTIAGEQNAQSGNSPMDLNQPSSIYMDSSLNIYIADTFNHRVQLWLNGSLSGTTVAGTGINGSQSNQLTTPRDVTMDPNSGTLYIADTGNHRIMSYASGVLNGSVAAGGNGPGTLSNQLYSPYAVYFNSSSNSLYILNYDTHCLVRWVIGASGWTLVAGQVGVSGSASAYLYYPYDFIFDSFSNIYVADSHNHRIQFFPSGLQNGTTIAGVTSATGSLSDYLNYPRSVALDQQYNLFVADSFNHRIQMFARY